MDVVTACVSEHDTIAVSELVLSAQSLAKVAGAVPEPCQEADKRLPRLGGHVVDGEYSFYSPTSVPSASVATPTAVPTTVEAPAETTREIPRTPGLPGIVLSIGGGAQGLRIVLDRGRALRSLARQSLSVRYGRLEALPACRPGLLHGHRLPVCSAYPPGRQTGWGCSCLGGFEDVTGG